MVNKKVLCPACGKPVKITELGAFTIDGVWHDNFICLMELAKRIGKKNDK